MDKKETIHVIGCGVLAPDINHIADKLGLTLKKTFLPGGLHSRPDELRRRLQQAIDEASQDDSCQRIVVGYGLCGRGTIGIKAHGAPLVFPRVHDCISLFMGSDQAYRAEFEKCPGTFYISAGWYKEKTEPRKGKETISIGCETLGCTELKEKYGEQGGTAIIDFFSSWHSNYQRAAFIDTGTGHDKAKASAAHAREMAKEHGWKYERIQGDLRLLTRLLTQEASDDEILVVPPAFVTTYSALKNGLDCAPKTTQGYPEQSGTRTLILGDNEEKGLSIRYGLGIDAGGTYTDAVIYDFSTKTILAKNKSLTTKWDFSIGIDKVLDGLDATLLSKVELVSVSTTLATNAIVEGEGQKTGLIFMTGSGAVSDTLISHTPRCNVGGYISITGQELEPVDENEIRQAAKKMKEKDGVTAFAVSGFGGAVNPIHELTAKRIIQEETGLSVCCGHELSDLLNVVIRAQTAVLNARIIPRMVKFFKELNQVLESRGITAPVMVVKGDGTLMSAEMAEERPVETTLSGPAASVAGAKRLTGLTDAMVVDMGGTTTDTAAICDDMVEVCATGANVGGFVTHVKALDMRTVGLGGDSLIRSTGEGFTLGPRRVAPLVWADSETNQGIDAALNFIATRPLANSFQTVLVAMEGKIPFKPTETETKIYTLLRKRPHAPEEVAQALDILSPLFLPLERLEGSGLVQQCGLTPTDLLHVNNDFCIWDPQPATRMLEMMAKEGKIDQAELIALLLEKIERQLALELMKKEIFNDVDDEEINGSPVAGRLIDAILGKDTPRYAVNARLTHPVIGIGAPVGYFLPKAGKLLNAEVIIPEDADVANALGAITSHVMIKQKLVIRPDSLGRFVVEGLTGSQTFKRIEDAENCAVENLPARVRSMARAAGTSSSTVTMEIKDRVVNTSFCGGLSLFLDRTITATLKGSPDLVLESVRQEETEPAPA